ncbi:hypothetical protein SAMN04487943_10935 [Gracilibacillus orientalis]|uniref:Uncharacterized protein n=1 Tax=Gracilibacillus orientalis TaxID=334253 RepID=A0A1I4NMQ7_9BACI|nr:hypothetical protein SAMN04487943_10935 [Gracilibacillus orientalis]
MMTFAQGHKGAFGKSPSFWRLELDISVPTHSKRNWDFFVQPVVSYAHGVYGLAITETAKTLPFNSTRTSALLTRFVSYICFCDKSPTSLLRFVSYIDFCDKSPTSLLRFVSYIDFCDKSPTSLLRFVSYIDFCDKSPTSLLRFVSYICFKTHS